MNVEQAIEIFSKFVLETHGNKEAFALPPEISQAINVIGRDKAFALAREITKDL